MTERTARLRRASLDARPALTDERAVLMTEFYQAHEGKYAVPVMRARAFLHLCERKTLWIGQDELIVGERGPAPKVVPTFPELTCHSVEDLEILNSRPKTHYDVDAECIRLYREKIIPYWRGRSMRDKIFAELPEEWKDAYAAGLFTEFMEQRAPGHTVLDDKIYRKGMLDFKKDIAEALAKLDFLNDPQALDKREALKSFDISCDALIAFAGRHAALARERAAKETHLPRMAELERIADVCSRVPAHAPRDFHEALQYYWFCHLAVITELNGWDSFNPGHLDQHLLPFFEQGLADGTLTKESARELLECFFIKFNNHPAPPKVGVTAAESGTYTDFANINIGGLLRDGSDGSNEVSHILLDIVDEMHLLQPSTNIQLSRKSPDHFLKHALRVVSQGYGFPSIFNADAVVQEQLRQGKTLEDARAGGCSGCVEVGAFGKEAYILTGYFNMPKVFEITLHNGVDPMTGKQLGPRTGVPEGAETLTLCPSVSAYRDHDQETTGAGQDPVLSEPPPRDSLSPQRGEGRGEGCDRPQCSPRDAGPRLLTPALSSIEEERERGPAAGLDRAAGRVPCPQPIVGKDVPRTDGGRSGEGASTDGPVIRTFEELFAAYRTQFKHFLEIKLRGNQFIERMYATQMPAPFLSVLTDDCIARGRDYNAGGARYNNTYIQFVGLGSLTDSLSAVKQMCFDGMARDGMGITRGPRVASGGPPDAPGRTPGLVVTLDGSSNAKAEILDAVSASRRNPHASGVCSPTRAASALFSTEGKSISIEPAPGAHYSRRNLPHFEKPWAIYHIAFSTTQGRQLASEDREIVLNCILHWNERRYRLSAACVMPDHVHMIIQPGIESQDADGNPIFYSLTTILHTIKSFTAHAINQRTDATGGLWEKESFDRYMRSDSDLEEKFHYLCRNPWDAGVVPMTERYPWLWTPDVVGTTRGPRVASGGPPDAPGSTNGPVVAIDGSSNARPKGHDEVSAGRRNPHASGVCSPELPLRKLVSVLEQDFAGEEPLRQRLINKTHKYGNDDDYADAITVRIFNTCFEELDGRPDTKGGRYRIEMLPTTCHVYFGSVTGATPDGRHARRPLSEGISPVQGADRRGPTAVIKSAAKMDHLKAGGTLLNMKFTPHLVASDDGLDKWAHLVRGYFKMDGHHVQFNVVRADTLRQAQAHPEEHRDLIVRVAGYSDYFCDLSKELQEEIIERTEHEGF